MSAPAGRSPFDRRHRGVDRRRGRCARAHGASTAPEFLLPGVATIGIRGSGGVPVGPLVFKTSGGVLGTARWVRPPCAPAITLPSNLLNFFYSSYPLLGFFFWYSLGLALPNSVVSLHSHLSTAVRLRKNPSKLRPHVFRLTSGRLRRTIRAGGKIWTGKRLKKAVSPW